MSGRAKRVLDVDLGALERGQACDPVRTWGRAPGDASDVSAEREALRRIGQWGGPALGLALFEREERAGDVLILSVGDCVRRGLPTAARASVLARSPLTGRLAEGQVGGDLGPYLSRVADALVLRGQTTLAGAVLVVRADGRVGLEAHPELRGATPTQVFGSLVGDDELALLSIGPAGEIELPFASLASGGERPSFVGRGGLGAVFGRLGLKALVIEGGDEPSERVERERGAAVDGELRAALLASPRLAARSAGGTLELYGAFAARGDLRARNYGDELTPDAGRKLFAEARSMRVERKGCRGCPTPCGWVFERSKGGGQRAHFSASYALGVNVGLERFEDSLELLATCDALAVDAKEVGAILALHALAQERGLVPGPADWGDRERLLARIEALVDRDDGGNDQDVVRAMRAGAVAFARQFGLEDELVSVHGQAARPEASYASVLGQCVSTGGSDPMRSFPFLIDAAHRDRLVELCADLGALPPHAEDASRPNGKGRLVYWHENLVAAVDATGFCVFSTAGLLADGVCDLDRLAQWILPADLHAPAEDDWASLSPGERLLAAGANLVLLRRALDLRAREDASDDVANAPAWARDRLSEAGMLDEYATWRGLADSGRVDPERWSALGTPRVLAPPSSESDAAKPIPDARVRAVPGSNGTVELRTTGALVGQLGDSRRVELPLPATVLEVLTRAAQDDAALGRCLIDDGQAIPAVWRSGARLRSDATVESGDVLDLVTAIAGG